MIIWNVCLDCLNTFSLLLIARNVSLELFETILILCCDLLSVPWIHDIWHNTNWMNWFNQHVVICFQFLEFTIFDTTVVWGCAIRYKLWFAFSSLNSRYLTQLPHLAKWIIICCDLLSVPWIHDIWHNYSGPKWLQNVLWFAFSSLNSRYLTQPCADATRAS